MKQPSELTRGRLEEFVGEVRDILWRDPVTGELDPDRPWTVETIEWVSGALEDAGLEPDSIPRPSPAPSNDPGEPAAGVPALSVLVESLRSVYPAAVLGGRPPFPSPKE